MNIVCIRHPDYKGSTSPQLSCKTCCALFLAELKRKNVHEHGGPQDPSQWLDEKAKQVNSRAETKL